MDSVELFDHLDIPRRNIFRKIDSVYIILYEDHFSGIPFYTYISINRPSPSRANTLGECPARYLAQRMERDIYQIPVPTLVMSFIFSI